MDIRIILIIAAIIAVLFASTLVSQKRHERQVAREKKVDARGLEHAIHPDDWNPLINVDPILHAHTDPHDPERSIIRMDGANGKWATIHREGDWLILDATRGDTTDDGVRRVHVNATPRMLRDETKRLLQAGTAADPRREPGLTSTRPEERDLDGMLGRDLAILIERDPMLEATPDPTDPRACHATMKGRPGVAVNVRKDDALVTLQTERDGRQWGDRMTLDRNANPGILRDRVRRMLEKA